MNKNDIKHLLLALKESYKSEGNTPNIGVVIVKGNRVISTGFNKLKVHKNNDTSLFGTLHAEIDAISKCAGNGHNTNGSVLYCTWHPCISCIDAIKSAGIKRIVYGNYLPELHKHLIFGERSERSKCEYPDTYFKENNIESEYIDLIMLIEEKEEEKNRLNESS